MTGDTKSQNFKFQGSKTYWRVQRPRDTKRQNFKFQCLEMYWRVQRPREVSKFRILRLRNVSESPNVRDTKRQNFKFQSLRNVLESPRAQGHEASKFQIPRLRNVLEGQMPRDTKRRNFMCHAICEMLKFCPKGPPNPRYGGKRFVPQEASREPNRFVTSLPQANPHGRCRAKANPASRPAKPATQQPASQQGQPAASTSRESIRFTISYIDLPVKLFHILRKRQPLS